MNTDEEQIRLRAINECIKIICMYCKRGDKTIISKARYKGKSVHVINGETHYCLATDLYELVRKTN